MATEQGLNELAGVQAGKYVTTFWDNHVQSTSARRNKLLDWYKQYRGIPNRRTYLGRANVFVNETLSAVESIVAQEVNAIFTEPRYVLLAPREPTDELKAQILEEAMFYYLDKIHWKSKIPRFSRQKVKYGTCFAETSWESEEGLQPKRVQGQALPDIQKVRIKDHPQVTYIDELDIALDYGKPDIQDMDGVVIRKRVTWDYIKKRERKGLYSSAQVTKVKLMNDGPQKGFDYLAGRAQRLSAVGVNILDFDLKEYTLLRYWGLVPRWWTDEGMDIESDEAQDMVPGHIEQIHNGPVLRLARNPFWHQEIPVAMCPHIPVDDEAYGIGTCEISESLQQELNDKRNQLLDHATDQIRPPIVENRAAGIGEIRWEPEFRIKSNLPADQALKPLYPGGNPTEVVVMEQRVQQDIRHKTGASDPVQGIQSKDNTTAFEVNQLTSRSSLRINLSTVNFGDQFLRRVYRQVYKNIQQFTDKDTIIRIVGAKGVKWETLTPEMVDVDVDIIPKISTDVDSRMMTRNQMIQFATAIAPVYPQANFGKLVRRIYELFGWDDVDEVIPKPAGEFDRGTLTTEEEMQALFLGQKMNVTIFDNHPAKLAALIQFMAQFESKMTPQAVDAFKDKIAQHMHYLQAMQAMSGQVQPYMGPGGARPSGAANAPAPSQGGVTGILRAATSPSTNGK